jgi:nitrate reductase gamma subunit
MISYIAGILIIALILGLAVLILRRVVRLLQSETTSRLMQ